MASKEVRSKKDIQEEVTFQIIRALQDGGIREWRKSWVELGLAQNFTTKKPYEGINQLLLMMVARKENWRNFWAGFGQIGKAGGKVTKGSKATPILYPIMRKGEREVKNSKTGKLETQTFMYVASFGISKVFNIAQTDLKVEDFVQIHSDNAPVDTAQALIDSIDHKVIEGNNPAYQSDADTIVMPPLEAFEASEHYYASYLHELTHWTGHKSRLDRDYGKKFGKQSYAFEELIAELGSAMLGSYTGIDLETPNHAGYIASWLQILENNHSAIFTASSQAMKAFKWLTEGEA